MKRKIRELLPNNEIENLEVVFRTMMKNTGSSCMYDKVIRKGLVKALRILEEWSEIEVEIKE